MARNSDVIASLTSFFEWNRKSSHKQPYLIHFADTSLTEEMLEVSPPATVAPLLGKRSAECEGVCREPGNYSEFEQVANGRMVTLAGLFDVWKGNDTVRLADWNKYV